MKQNILSFFKHFPTDEACLEHLFEVRFGQGHECSKCKRSAKWYRIKAERAYSCQWCGNHLHPTVGTPFAKSRTSLQLWFFAIFLFVKSRNGVSAKELQRQLGVTYKCAWRMGHEIRKHMSNVDGDEPLGGIGKIVEVDETYVGGFKRGGQGGRGKAIVMGMVEKNGDVISFTIPRRDRNNMIGAIEKYIADGSEIHTDTAQPYKILREHQEYTHLTVDHSISEYVGDFGQTTNAIEGYFGQLKRSINGTYISVSPEYLQNYAKECEYRYNRRDTPHIMLPELLSVFPS